MKFSWFNTSEAHNQYQAYDMNNMMQCKV